MKKRKKAVVAGHICIDITPVFSEKQVTNLNTLFLPGKLIHTEGVDIHAGGSVANTGLAMKILGVDVRLMGKVGKDDFGRILLNNLMKYEADESMIISKDSDTSYSIVLAVPGVDRIFLHNPGANDTFSCEDLEETAIEEADLFHFGYPTLMRMMYQNQGEELIKILKKVKETDTAISLDMAAIDSSSRAAEADWKSILVAVLPYVDFFVPSVEELCFMLDRSRYERWKKQAGIKEITDILTLEEVKCLGDMVIELGAKVVLIKCGAPGIYYRTAPKEEIGDLCDRLELPLESWAEKEGFEAGYHPDRVVSGTGAGDVSIAAFLASVLEGSMLEEALHLATAEGACCVTSYDALSGLKSLEKLREKIQQGWQKEGKLANM